MTKEKYMLEAELKYVWVPFSGKYPSPLMTRDLGPPRMDDWTRSGSPWPIGVVI